MTLNERFAAHADFCAWHVDQHNDKCDCAAMRDVADVRERPMDAPPPRSELTNTSGLWL